MRTATALLSISFLLVLHAGSVSADDVGAVGSVAAFDVNDDSADLYLQYYGRVFVKNADGNLDEYRWGGTSCGTRVLTEEQVAVLQRTLANNKMRIEPRSQPGQGDIKCLVGFSMADKKTINLIP